MSETQLSRDIAAATAYLPRWMTLLALAFAALALLVWMTSAGYLLGLAVLAWWRRRARPAASGALPPITVVMAVRDEAPSIEAKLADLWASDYPADRMRLLIVEAGSNDDTAARVTAATAGDPRVTLQRVNTARHKTDQMRAALATAQDEIIVATDADGRLAPDCVRRLVQTLDADPATAMVGAWVEPASALREERLHWALLNRLWWLEGEAIGAAGISGVCCAMRRSAVTPPTTGADDIALALSASAHGYRVRLCRQARARELRVPQSFAELLRFRRRRGRGYLDALDAAPAGGHRGARLARAVRRFHFRVTPLAALALLGLGLTVLETAAWPLVPIAAAGFALPLAALAWRTRSRDSRPQLALAFVRLLAVTWLAMLSLPRRYVTAAGDAPLPVRPASGGAHPVRPHPHADLAWHHRERQEG
jgi:cellulose synthase/poly-beta-1,6-N-acetylglucosamine synthase-like glycosyltransferase